MGFMQQQVTDKRTWVEIDGNQGITVVPADVFSKEELAIAESVDGDDLTESADLMAHFGDYYEGSRIDSVSVVTGFGARLSAPGYMDCTDWAVFDTEEEAQAYLDENYPDDEEDEEESE